MLRKIVKIDEEKCNGCGACASVCHEGAIEIINNKAKLTKEDYCDGLGDCLPACPVNAISFEEREVCCNKADVLKEKEEKPDYKKEVLSCVCFNSYFKTAEKEDASSFDFSKTNLSRLAQWPVQIKLAPLSAPYFHDADLLIAADCTAYAYGNFHNDFIKGRIALIGCPKLDNIDYSTKLANIIKNNRIKSIAVVKMEVPCCKGIEIAVSNALKECKKDIPLQVFTVSVKGEIIK